MSNSPFDYNALSRATQVDPIAYELIARQAAKMRQRNKVRAALALAAASVVAAGISSLTILALTSESSDPVMASDPPTSSAGLSETEWQASIAEYKARLLKAANRYPEFSSARLDYDKGELVLYGTGQLPQSLRELVDQSPTQVLVRWESVEHSTEDYRDASAHIQRKIPEVSGTEWNGLGPLILILDPSYRPREELVLARARELTAIPLEIRYEKPPVAG